MEIKKKIRVLAVDDLPENLKVLGSILVKNGFEISMATNGKQALELAKKFNPDVILLDIMMPDMDGYETCTLIKNEELVQHIPVIFLTAKTESDAMIKGFEVGAVDYVTKPFNSKELLSRVNVHSALKIARDQLLAQKEELEKLNLTKTKLFSIIGHDLKAPLNSIFGLMQLVDMKVLDENGIKECFESLKTSVSNTSELLNNLLNWSASQISNSQLQLKEINVNDLIEEKIKNLHFYAGEKNITLFANVSPNLTMKTDAQSVMMVIRNIVKNAIKFTPENGSIKINVDENIDSKMIQFSIIDTGVGIPKPAIEKILGAGFYTTDGTHGEKGTGLGLLLCREYIQKLNGSFQIESEIGKGTTMKFSLPK